MLGNPGEQPALSFQISAPGVDSIWQTAYVHSSKSPVQFLLLFFKKQRIRSNSAEKMLDYGRQTDKSERGPLNQSLFLLCVQ